MVSLDNGYLKIFKQPMVKTICTPQSNNGEENIKSPNIFMAVYYELSDFCTNGQISGLWQNRHVTQDKCYMRYLWRSGHLIIYWGIQFCAWRLSLLYRIQNICMVTRTSLCPFVLMRSNAQVFRDLLCRYQWGSDEPWISTGRCKLHSNNVKLVLHCCTSLYNSWKRSELVSVYFEF